MSHIEHKIKKLMAMDQNFGLSGVKSIPSENSANSEETCAAFIAQAVHCDAHLAEAYTKSQTTDPLSEIRVLIHRGKMEEAHQLIQQYKEKLGSSHIFFSELLQEEARLFFFDGNYEQGLKLTLQTLEFNPPPISRLALMEMQSLALFELGEFSAALNILNETQALAKLFPFCVSSHYLKALEIKLKARIYNVDVAQKMLNEAMISALKEQNFNYDALSTLIRAQIDLLILSQQDFSQWALAEYWIASSMGEDLYIGLALVHLYCSKSYKNNDHFTKQLFNFERRFKRIQRLIQEINAGTHVIQMDPLGEKISSPFNPLEEPQALLFKSLRILILLNKNNLQYKIFDLQDHIPKALITLANNPCTKEEFFKLIWEQGKYVPHLHDGVIRNLVFRIRKKTGLSMQFEKGILSISGLLVL